MDKQTCHKLKHGLCAILERYSDQVADSPKALEIVRAALSSLSKLMTIEAMEKLHGDCHKGDDNRGLGAGYRDVVKAYTKPSIKGKLEDLVQEANDSERDMLLSLIRKM